MLTRGLFEYVAKLSQWLSEHNQFPKIDVIMSIDSGIVGEDVKPEGSQYVVVDGGHLLHKIVWRQQATFGAIADRYVQYLNNKYGQDIAVIFDGFPDDDKKSTKNCERLRRAANFSPDVMFHEETVLQYTKEKLLANECNKKRFIELLKKALQKANICVQQAVEDADITIVNTAISVAPQYDYMRVVGEDIDLLVLLIALASTHSNVFSKSVEEGKRQIVITQPHHLIINSRMNFCLFMLSVVVISHEHCLAKSCENPMPVILDNESEEGDAPEPIDMVDEQLECEDIEL
ncbi:hypothetical protein AVEN_70799-1 [Araneus ventricosus]|uniref:Uncharacterized protein n=1 Tax=Araneus ventricosus TaxID=182803 RepID=A0A4Y2R0H4_ARAVE|nr:hypothetical protein AVEN_70799-1 [Araneus ventricosus]